MTTDEFRKRLAAIHEAGHVAMTLFYGYEEKDIRASISRASDGIWDGDTDAPTPPERFRQVMVAWAGQAAVDLWCEIHHYVPPDTRSDEDMEVIGEASAEEFKEQAKRYLRQNWKRVCQVARVLFDKQVWPLNA